MRVKFSALFVQPLRCASTSLWTPSSMGSVSAVRHFFSPSLSSFSSSSAQAFASTTNRSVVSAHAAPQKGNEAKESEVDSTTISAFENEPLNTKGTKSKSVESNERGLPTKGDIRVKQQTAPPSPAENTTKHSTAPSPSATESAEAPAVAVYLFSETSNNPVVAKLIAQTDNLVKEVLSGNWSDYWSLVVDSPFWFAEAERIFEKAQPYLYDPMISSKIRYLNRLLDVLHRVEDIRDDINEVIEQTSRSSGIAGTGLFAHPKVENVEDHATEAARQYDILMEEYSEFRPQIEEVVGYALALLRQKQRYDWSTMHSYFY